jgi:hypothetical protein
MQNYVMPPALTFYTRALGPMLAIIAAPPVRLEVVTWLVTIDCSMVAILEAWRCKKDQKQQQLTEWSVTTFGRL